MQQPVSAAPAVIVMEKDYVLVGEKRVHTLDEMVAALRAQQATLINLRIGEAARGNYERVGLVVYGLSRHGFDIADIDMQGEGVSGRGCGRQ